ATLGLAFCWFLILLIYDIPRTKEYVPVKVNFILSHLKVILITALPLAFFQLLLSLNTNMSRYFVGYYYSETELGYFGAVSYIVIASINLISNALTQSTIAIMSRSCHEKKYK